MRASYLRNAQPLTYLQRRMKEFTIRGSDFTLRMDRFCVECTIQMVAFFAKRFGKAYGEKHMPSYMYFALSD